MKITKSYIKKLIKEALTDIKAEPDFDPEGAYGVDPTGEKSKEAKYLEGEAEESEAVAELESIITSLMNVKKKLELAQSKEGK